MVAKNLEDREKRCLARCRGRLEHLAQLRRGVRPGHHALMLQEPGRAVHPVPVADAVEREQVLGEWRGRPTPLARRAGAVERVERAYRMAIERLRRKIEGDGEPRAAPGAAAGI